LSKLPFEFFRLPIRILPASMPPRSIGFCQPPLPSPHSSSSAFPSVSRTVLFYLSRSFPLALPVEPFRPPPFLWLANYSHSIYLHPFPVHSLYANSYEVQHFSRPSTSSFLGSYPAIRSDGIFIPQQ
jgi:hypothetical protein